MRHICVKKGSRFEARSITISKSTSFSPYSWNHSWQASPKCFPYTIATKVLPHAMLDSGHGHRNLVCLCWTGFLGLHNTWVKAGVQALVISYSKVMRPLKGHQQCSWRTPVLKPTSNFSVPVAWITAPTTDSQ